MLQICKNSKNVYMCTGGILYIYVCVYIYRERDREGERYLEIFVVILSPSMILWFILNFYKLP